jgi:hypothetical protein
VEEFTVTLNRIKHQVTALAETVGLVSFVRKAIDQHYPLSAECIHVTNSSVKQVVCVKRRVHFVPKCVHGTGLWLDMFRVTSDARIEHW